MAPIDQANHCWKPGGSSAGSSLPEALEGGIELLHDGHERLQGLQGIAPAGEGARTCVVREVPAGVRVEAQGGDPGALRGHAALPRRREAVAGGPEVGTMLQEVGGRAGEGGCGHLGQGARQRCGGIGGVATQQDGELFGGEHAGGADQREVCIDRGELLSLLEDVDAGGLATLESELDDLEDLGGGGPLFGDEGFAGLGDRHIHPGVRDARGEADGEPVGVGLAGTGVLCGCLNAEHIAARKVDGQARVEARRGLVEELVVDVFRLATGEAGEA